MKKAIMLALSVLVLSACGPVPSTAKPQYGYDNAVRRAIFTSCLESGRDFADNTEQWVRVVRECSDQSAKLSVVENKN